MKDGQDHTPPRTVKPDDYADLLRRIVDVERRLGRIEGHLGITEIGPEGVPTRGERTGPMAQHH